MLEPAPVGIEQTKCNLLQSSVYGLCAFNQSWIAACHVDSQDSCPMFRCETCPISQNNIQVSGLNLKI